MKYIYFQIKIIIYNEVVRISSTCHIKKWKTVETLMVLDEIVIFLSVLL